MRNELKSTRLRYQDKPEFVSSNLFRPKQDLARRICFFIGYDMLVKLKGGSC